MCESACEQRADIGDAHDTRVCVLALTLDAALHTIKRCVNHGPDAVGGRTAQQIQHCAIHAAIEA